VGLDIPLVLEFAIAVEMKRLILTFSAGLYVTHMTCALCQSSLYTLGLLEESPMTIHQAPDFSNEDKGI
jgi:hypothetical protein